MLFTWLFFFSVILPASEIVAGVAGAAGAGAAGAAAGAAGVAATIHTPTRLCLFNKMCILLTKIIAWAGSQNTCQLCNGSSSATKYNYWVVNTSRALSFSRSFW